MEGATFMSEEYIVVTADSGIPRPLVPWENSKSARLVVYFSLFVQVLPKFFLYLKIIRLVTGDIEESLVSCKIQIAFNRVGSYGFACLPV